MKESRFFAGASLCAVAFAAPLSADAPSAADAAKVAAVFGARQQVGQISLSPDGTKVAYIAPEAGVGSKLIVRGIGDGGSTRVIMTADGKPGRLGGCHWVSADRLVCVAYGVGKEEGRFVPFSRLFAIDADGKNTQELNHKWSDNLFYSRGSGEVVDWLPDENGAILLARNQASYSHAGLAVDHLDTRTLDSKVVEPAKRGAIGYISDGHGLVRIHGMVGFDHFDINKSNYQYFYRKKDSREWNYLSEWNPISKAGFLPVAVDYDQNLVYGFSDLDGRDALFSVSLDGVTSKKLIFSRPDVDVDADGLVFIGRHRRVIGVSFETDTRNIYYFDASIEKLIHSLEHALPEKTQVQVIDSSFDDRKLLIFAGSDVDPGAYYVFDRDTHTLRVFMTARPELEGRQLAAMKPIHYRTGDGTMIPAYLTLPPGTQSARGLPAIVMPHGGPASRDNWGFNWLPQFFAARGYAVIQPEFRGSTGYGDAWYQQNGFRSWRIAIGDVVDAGRWLVGQGIADPAKLTILGWSYGGYAALQSAVMAPDLFKAVIAIAPVTDLRMLKAESEGWSDNPFVRNFIGSGPEVSAGSPAQNAAKIKAPILLFHGTDDANVGYGESTLMIAKMMSVGGRAKLTTFPGLDHQLEDGEAREKMLEESDTFLRAATAK